MTSGRIEYLDLFRAVSGHGDRLIGGDITKFVESVSSRHTLTGRFAWAVPSSQALDVIARHSPIVEMGAGTGYWAHLLRERGVDVIAYDKCVPGTNGKANSWHKTATTYTDVRLGTPGVLKRHPDRTLFLCWPPYAEQMAYESVRIWKGETLIYIGEESGGCTANDRFFKYVGRHFREVCSVAIPHWWTVHDSLQIYERIA